ncbi:MAG: hypothetical protein JSS89_05415 [Bacteroidetes bacterium]|nr:hypothetical protein [Bacteroidota bacterium]
MATDHANEPPLVSTTDWRESIGQLDRDTTIVQRRWIGGTELWMCPIVLSAPMTADVRVILLSLISGALGAALHVFISLSGFVGNRTFKTSWIMWYVLRMPTGATLGLILTCALHGGMPTDGVSYDGSNPYQIYLLAGIAGLFSRSALDKLEDVFETLFKTARNDERLDNINAPDPNRNEGDAENEVRNN